METKFQTSFIPKKPILAESTNKVRSSISIFTVISVTIFLLSLAAAGGSIAWQKFLKAQLVDYQKQLDDKRQQFDPALIETLKRANIKIDNAKKIMENHLASSDVFSLISNLTIENVRFKSFEFAGPIVVGDEVKIVMKGQGSTFKAIAYQSDVFGRNKIIKNPILSDLSLEQNGRVNFTFTGTIDPKVLLYKTSLERGGGIPFDQIIEPEQEQVTIDESQQ